MFWAGLSRPITLAFWEPFWSHLHHLKADDASDVLVMS